MGLSFSKLSLSDSTQAKEATQNERTQMERSWPKPIKDRTDIISRFPSDVLSSICQYLSVYDLGHLQFVNRHWRDFLAGAEGESCWYYALSAPPLGKKEWDILASDKTMKRAVYAGRNRADSEDTSDSSTRWTQKESDAVWVRLGEKDTRGDIALTIPACRAVTAHRDTHWEDARGGGIFCYQLGLCRFDTMATFHNVPEGDYMVSIQFAIYYDGYYKLKRFMTRHGSVDLSHISQHIMVGDPCKTTGEVENPSWESMIARVLAGQLEKKPDRGLEHRYIRIDTPGVKVVNAGSTVSVRLRDVSDQRHKAALGILFFELVRSPRY